VCEEVLDVILEVGDDCGVCIELHCVWWQRRLAAGDVEACPAKESELSTVVVILKCQPLTFCSAMEELT
jgi:hypothetical protein